MQEIHPKEKERVLFSGNIVFFYAYDIGDDIDLAAIGSKHLVPLYDTPPSARFKNYHLPLSYYLPFDGLAPEGDDQAFYKKGAEGDGQQRMASVDSPCYVLSKIHSFGVISLSFRIPFQNTFEDIKEKLVFLKRESDQKADSYAHETFNRIQSSVVSAQFCNLKNEYFAVHVNPLAESINGEEVIAEYGADIVSLLRLEVNPLSYYQQNTILRSRTGYYGDELMIIDGSGSFVYDEKCYDSIELFEFATVQLLELQYFDKILDRRLNRFYTHHLDSSSERQAASLEELAQLRVDISVITERLENSIRMAGDEYYTEIYDRLVKKLAITRWRDAVHRKLSIIRDLYEVHQTNQDLLFHKKWTIVIVVLIALESIVGFVHLVAHYFGYLR